MFWKAGRAGCNNIVLADREARTSQARRIAEIAGPNRIFLIVTEGSATLRKLPSNSGIREPQSGPMSNPGKPQELHRKEALAVVAVIAVAGVFAYLNSLDVPFLFDDGPAIVSNTSIRDLTDLRTVLSPTLEEGVTTKGRPVLNLSFALTHAVSGLDVRGFHAVNIAVHLLNALLLFGVTRRFFSRSGPGGRTERASIVASAAVATIWMLHPIQTAAVTYVVQRAESLCALFLLFTLYSFIRASEGGHPRTWLAASVAACALGMGTKEVSVVAPLIVLIYDRTFLAGTFTGALRARPAYYAGLASTWILLCWLVLGFQGRGTTAGLETVVTPWEYLITQADALVQYVRLAFWPSPLVFDYGTATAGSILDVWWQALFVVALLGVACWALVRRLAFGFWGSFAFLILAPSSSVVPIASQTVAEHRMYLPLAALVVFLVAAISRLSPRPAVLATVSSVLCVPLAILTADRNRDYASAESIWRHTVEELPSNPRARINLAIALEGSGRLEEALAQLDQAVSTGRPPADAHFNRGRVLASMGRTGDARSAYAEAVRVDPGHAEAWNNLGILALREGNLADAEQDFRSAISARPGHPAAHINLSSLLLDQGRALEALSHAEQALAADPGSGEAEFRRGNALLAVDRRREALEAFSHAVEMDPRHADAHNNLANMLVEQGDLRAALRHYESAIAVEPRLIAARTNAAQVLAYLGRTREAIGQYEELVRIAPDRVEFRQRLLELKNGTR